MNSYNLRAMSTMNEPVIFSVTEIPVRISDDEFILALRKDSPILRLSTIVRGADSHDLFEGDTIRIGDVCYKISYSCGFVAISDDKQIIQLNELGDYTRESYGIYGNRSLAYKVREELICLSNIIGAYDGFAIINKFKDKTDPSEFQQDAGLTLDKKRLFFGDIYKGGLLVMKNGRPCIEVDGEFVDITRKG